MAPRINGLRIREGDKAPLFPRLKRSPIVLAILNRVYALSSKVAAYVGGRLQRPKSSHPVPHKRC